VTPRRTHRISSAVATLQPAATQALFAGGDRMVKKTETGGELGLAIRSSARPTRPGRDRHTWPTPPFAADLPTERRRPRRSEFRALREAHDHVVHAGRPSRGGDILGTGFGVEAGDVLGHRTRGQLHVLRQVANVRTQRFNRPMVKNDTIYADAAMNWLPRAN
jgi:hypothetical protein